MSSPALENFLDKFTVSELVQGRELYWVESKTSVKQTLKKLQDKRILSMPVFDKGPEHKAKNGGLGKYIGLITIGDIVQGLAFNPWFDKITMQKEKPTKEDLSRLVKFSILESKVSEIVGEMTEEGKHLIILDENDKLKTALKLFAKGQHRALVVRSKGGPCMLSQSDCVKFLSNKLNYEEAIGTKVGLLFERSLSNTNLLDENKQVKSVRADEIALMGYRELGINAKDPLAALPVVDSKTGKVVATLSESDLRGIDEHTLTDLLLPVTEFIKKSDKDTESLLTFEEDTTLGDAIFMLSKKSAHRAWIVDDDRECVLSHVTTIYYY